VLRGFWMQGWRGGAHSKVRKALARAAAGKRDDAPLCATNQNAPALFLSFLFSLLLSGPSHWGWPVLLVMPALLGDRARGGERIGREGERAGRCLVAHRGPKMLCFFACWLVGLLACWRWFACSPFLPACPPGGSASFSHLRARAYAEAACCPLGYQSAAR